LAELVSETLIPGYRQRTARPRWWHRFNELPPTMQQELLVQLTPAERCALADRQRGARTSLTSTPRVHLYNVRQKLVGLLERQAQPRS
jgi:hypothetical protein